PPDKALVLSVDEKSQIQALDRTQPGLPMKKGRAGTMTHDYKRHGTTTLFAALNMLDGSVIGQSSPSGVPALPQDYRPADPGRSRSASDRRQLCHPQDRRGETLAQAAQALQSALHSDLGFLAQYGRALLR